MQLSEEDGFNLHFCHALSSRSAIKCCCYHSLKSDVHVAEFLRAYEEDAEGVMESLADSDKNLPHKFTAKCKVKHLLNHNWISYEFKLAGD